MAQDLAGSGLELPALMTAGRWSSPTMPTRYTWAQLAWRGAVAKYYGNRAGMRRCQVRESLHKSAQRGVESTLLHEQARSDTMRMCWGEAS